MSIQWIKNDAHRMIDIMWGNSSKGYRRAYHWLNSNLGYIVHFSTSSDKDVREAHQMLYKRFVEKGFDYLRDKPLRTMNPRKVKPHKPKPHKPKKEKFKSIVAPNLRELQKNHKTTVQRKTRWERFAEWVFKG